MNPDKNYFIIRQEEPTYEDKWTVVSAHEKVGQAHLAFNNLRGKMFHKIVTVTQPVVVDPIR